MLAYAGRLGLAPVTTFVRHYVFRIQSYLFRTSAAENNRTNAAIALHQDAALCVSGRGDLPPKTVPVEM